MEEVTGWVSRVRVVVVGIGGGRGAAIGQSDLDQTCVRSGSDLAWLGNRTGTASGKGEISSIGLSSKAFLYLFDYFRQTYGNKIT